MSWKKLFNEPNITDITIDTKDGEITTEKNGKTYLGIVGFIQSQRDMLQGFLNEGRSPNPSETRWKIKLYDFMLNADEPEKKVSQYMAARHHDKKNGKPRPEREVIEELGWIIE